MPGQRPMYGLVSRCPSVSVVIPTFQSQRTIGWALDSLAAQDYPGDVEVLVVDGGSTDGTVERARAAGATVVPNPERVQERGMAIGIREASGDLVLLLDGDNELPHAGWLRKMADAFEHADDIAGSDALFHSARATDPAIVRLAAVMGGTDPIAIDLGWADRWAHHRDRWTAMPVDVEDADGDLLVRIDPDRAPPMGSNGFLVRRELLLAVDYDPFLHPEVVADIARLGWRFARVDDSIIHHYAAGLRDALGKSRRRTVRGIARARGRAVAPPKDPRSLAWVALRSLTLVGPIRDAIHGYRNAPDRAWVLYPLVHVHWTLCYAEQLARALASRAIGSRREPPALEPPAVARG